MELHAGEHDGSDHVDVCDPVKRLTLLRRVLESSQARSFVEAYHLRHFAQGVDVSRARQMQRGTRLTLQISRL